MLDIKERADYCVNETAHRESLEAVVTADETPPLGIFGQLEGSLDFRGLWNWGWVPDPKSRRGPQAPGSCSVESVPGGLTRRCVALNRAEKDTTIHSGSMGISLCLIREEEFEWLSKDEYELAKQ